jgi:ATPase subunit of ABC transporter with duplicated ATPase domains
MTSHDREFMNRLVSKIAEIDGGEIITYSGDYDFYERERAVRESNQQAAIARPVSRRGRGKTPKSSLLHDDTACYWLFSALLL